MPTFKRLSVVYYFGDMSLIFIIREVYIDLFRSTFPKKNHLKDMLKDVKKNDRFHITVQGTLWYMNVKACIVLSNKRTH